MTMLMDIRRPVDSRNGRGLRPVVLVVDDDPTVRELVCDVMDVAGWSTLTARNGEDAVRQVQEHAPDVVLLDVALPRMSGLDVMRLLKSAAWSGPRSRVVILSGYARLLTDADVELADGVVSKPFDVDELVEVVEAARGALLSGAGNA